MNVWSFLNENAIWIFFIIFMIVEVFGDTLKEIVGIKSKKKMLEEENARLTKKTASLQKTVDRLTKENERLSKSLLNKS